MLTREQIVKMFVEKIYGDGWHWLAYHFSTYARGCEHFLAASIVDSCLEIECSLNGYSEEFSTRLSSLSGKDKHLPHYEQIIQLLSELYAICHIIEKGGGEATFVHEPTAEGSEKNPELGVTFHDKELYFEVKCRQFIEHHNNRGNAAIELPSRQEGAIELASMMGHGANSIVLPRDNVVKDFLVSADLKFSGFKKHNPNCVCVLIIVWDDFAYEPISSLMNKASGLLTEKSFFQDEGEPVSFENIDAVLVVRQSHHIVRATRSELPVDGLRHPLDWGKRGDVLPKALIPVSELSVELIEYLCDFLEAVHIEALQKAADYRPQEFVMHL
ncbi:hypothetical protein DU490_00090 [Halomonas sp. DQ26W]|uniref:hypothetical protein n=1 Tax=Halomonas sp. DQ26W TaxID=2282311 RepID=UPI000DF86478|nr:hypothetical protein [Halomonas sp. DQ26W]RDB44732.1 hypothetical protein DU490_00090 [Halomonas sp. DQ26W]